MLSPRLKHAGLWVALALVTIAALQPVVVAIVDSWQARQNAARLSQGIEADNNLRCDQTPLIGIQT